MSITEKLMEQARSPSGLLGQLMGVLMNLSHGSAYEWGLDHISLEPASAILDVGCGGGRVVQLLVARAPQGRVCGLDHSPQMDELARKVNRTLIERGRVEIAHCSVSSLPYADATFDLVTAFETIQFWPHISKDLREVERVLKPSGTLLIVNRCAAPDSEDSSWGESLQIHDSEEYRERLAEAGYAHLSIDDTSKANWIAVRSQKP